MPAACYRDDIRDMTEAVRKMGALLAECDQAISGAKSS